MQNRKIDLSNIYNPSSFSTVRENENSYIFRIKRKPFERIAESYGKLIERTSIDAEQSRLLANKIENACRKILMMCKAGDKAIKCEEEIMMGQDRELPALIWDDEIELLYHVEAMILFARSSLDIIAYVFSIFLFRKRMDSFNDFRHALEKVSDSGKIEQLKTLIKKKQRAQDSWMNLLVGTEKGRSLRDRIAHQTIVKFEFEQIETTWEDLFCHVVFAEKPIRLDSFVEEVTKGVIDFCLMVEDAVFEPSED